MATVATAPPAAVRGSDKFANYATPVKAGLIAGAVGIYIAATGIVNAFSEREVISEIIKLSYFVYIMVSVVAGYLAAKPRRDEEHAIHHLAPATAITFGAITGVIAGLMMTIWVFLIDTIEMRTVLTNVNATQIQELTFEKSVGYAALLFIVGGALLGALGAVLHLLSDVYRRSLIAAVSAVVIFALGEQLLNDFITGLQLKTAWLFESGGLTLIGAVIIFLLVGGLAFVWRTGGGDAIRARTQAFEPRQRQMAKWGLFAIMILALLAVPQIVNRFHSEILGTVMLYILLGLGLNIVVGYAGLLDLGYVAFYAIGAYTAAILTSPRSPLFAPEMNFFAALPIIIIVTTLAGIMIGAPVLRLRGDYLAIVTLAFGEIIRIVVLSNWASPMLGGAQGITGVPNATLGALDFGQPEELYYVLLIFVLLVAFIAWRLKTSRVGRAWNAMREDEQVAEAIGISVIKYKIMAFAMGAGLGCFSGAFFAAKIGSIFPNSFGLLVSINVLAVVILGGMGSIPGVVVGALVLVGLPDLLREFEEYRLLFYGMILMAVMILKPEGLIPDRRRARELHDDVITPEEEFEEVRAGQPTPTKLEGA